MENQRHIGNCSGMGVMQYQDFTLSINDRPERELTDAQLVEDWAKEHPDALHLGKQNDKGIFTYVRDIRRNYNQGTEQHGVRNSAGAIIGPGRPMSKPYDENENAYVYSAGGGRLVTRARVSDMCSSSGNTCLSTISRLGCTVPGYDGIRTCS